MRQGKFNQELSYEELDTYAPLTTDADKALADATAKHGFSLREVANIRKVARTLEDMSNTDSSTAIRNITFHFVNEAIRLYNKTIPIEP
jgi:predicted ATPase with chaperone activity